MAERNKPEPEIGNAGRTAPRCAVCERPVLAQFRPFCSRRCADADLGRWLTGDYRIPGPALDEGEPDAGGGEI